MYQRNPNMPPNRISKEDERRALMGGNRLRVSYPVFYQHHCITSANPVREHAQTCTRIHAFLIQGVASTNTAKYNEGQRTMLEDQNNRLTDELASKVNALKEVRSFKLR